MLNVAGSNRIDLVCWALRHTATGDARSKNSLRPLPERDKVD